MHTTTIKSIQKLGFEQTYDIKSYPNENFYLKNGILSSNSGKSWLSFQLGKYVDPTLNLKRIVFNAEDFRSAILKAKKGDCIIYDEAFTGLSSRNSLAGVNKVLISLMMQMRQKNLFVILVLPSFFLLDKYAALFRTNVLIHVYECEDIRGYFKVYSRTKKKNLYLFGRQTYSYVPKQVQTRFKGRFYGVFALGDEKVEEEYRFLKDRALKDSEKTPMTAAQIRYRDQRDIMIFLVRKFSKFTYQQLSDYIAEYDYDISSQQVALICQKFGDKTYKLDSKPLYALNREKNKKENLLKNSEIPPKPEEIPPKNDKNLPKQIEAPNMQDITTPEQDKKLNKRFTLAKSSYLDPYWRGQWRQ